MFKLRKYTAPDFSLDKFKNAPDAVFENAEADGVAPENFHAMSIFPEYMKVNGKWLLAEESRMDCVAVLENNKIVIKEFRLIKKGDKVLVGRTENCEDGIYLHTNGFNETSTQEEAFSFRRNRSRETAFTQDYNELYDILRHDRDHGKIVWVMGPAFAFDWDARNAMSRLIEGGYVHAVLAGNALATHDLEGALLHTALGADITTQRTQYNGHYNHLDTINKVRAYGSIPAFLEGEKLTDGIIASCVQCNVPFVLVGSVRDDGPLPEVYHDVYAGQDDMRSHVKQATTVIGMATTLHTIATGNLTPSYHVEKDDNIRPVYFYSVDTSDFSANKLADRGSLSAKGIVANAQDFITKIAAGLGL